MAALHVWRSVTPLESSLIVWLVPLRRFAPLLMSTACLASAAHADLGGSVSGVRADSARMNARMTSISQSGYTRHELTRGNGGMVREFTNAAGQVFAVTWSGPGKPDLRAVLGSYFTALQNNATGRRMHGFRQPQQVAQTDLQIQTGGHMGWFQGMAFIPSLAPKGVSTSDLPVQP